MVFIQEIYVTNLDENKSIRTHWAALYVNDDKGEHLTMKHTLIVLLLSIFQKKLKNS